ncbi:hypothetical protein RR46_09939 [Papilio xuthus]|uniref:Uncharacterized protein n=1 Tax=Papilio xuthus TaxID=66420 RepID=A0A194QH16_PAPXU|nr:hypothetical protein RR46_09939 [Papilio xuthus]
MKEAKVAARGSRSARRYAQQRDVGALASRPALRLRAARTRVTPHVPRRRGRDALLEYTLPVAQPPGDLTTTHHQCCIFSPKDLRAARGHDDSGHLARGRTLASPKHKSIIGKPRRESSQGSDASSPVLRGGCLLSPHRAAAIDRERDGARVNADIETVRRPRASAARVQCEC